MNLNDESDPLDVILDNKEFFRMMEQRGLVVRRSTSLKGRAATVFFYPFRLFHKGLSAVARSLWGKRRHNRKIREGLVARWKKLIAPHRSAWPEDTHVTKVGQIDSRTDGITRALFDEALRKAVLEPLPKPDVE